MKKMDLFSGHSTEYAKFRPTYPPELFLYLSSLVSHHKHAWDCGAGNGQAALALAPYFELVSATDLSDRQIKNAPLHPKVLYRATSAEESGLESKSIDLITVAQAFHWFDQEAAFKEFWRVGKLGGVVAFWCYELAQITPEIDELVLYLYKDILGGHWSKERKLVEEGYSKVNFPPGFFSLPPPRFFMTEEWDLNHLLGYLNTWSALQDFLKVHGKNPLEEMGPQFKAAFDLSGGPARALPVKWELGLRVARIVAGE